jgi:hypothetical protein
VYLNLLIDGEAAAGFSRAAARGRRLVLGHGLLDIHAKELELKKIGRFFAYWAIFNLLGDFSLIGRFFAYRAIFCLVGDF